MTLKRNWLVPDGSGAREEGDKTACIPAGIYEIECVPNPFGHGHDFLVVKGTLVGAVEGYWRRWTNDAEHDWEDFEVVITDEIPDGATLSDASLIGSITE